jgi:predicted MPP superfamily phosphohydrolase
VITRRQFLTGAGVVTGAGAALTGYAVGVEPNMVVDTVYRPRPKSWPDDLPLRMVVMSDIHASEPWLDATRLTAICARANALNPDIILILGDYRSGMRLKFRETPIEDWAAALATLKAPLGVHAILGNHDYWEDREAQNRLDGPTQSEMALREFGVPVYVNDAVRLEKDGRGFWLAGLGDQVAFLPTWWSRRHSGDRTRYGMDDLPATLAKLATGEPAILMAHEPDIFPQVPDRIALTLSGHTHGGQVRLFGYSPVVPSEFGNRYAYGHVIEEERHLVVTSGLGFSKIPVRIGIPPELVTIELGGSA